MEGVRLTYHAVDRYIERVRPALAPRLARRDLLTLIAGIGSISASSPAWYAHHAPADAFLLLGGDIVLPLLTTPRGYLAVTCITRGSLPASLREARNRDSAARRHRRRIKPRPRGRPRGTPDALAPAHGGAW